MNKDIVKEWTTALRSGDYQQGRLQLRKDARFCCLGVLCDLYHKNTCKGRWTILELEENGDGFLMDGISETMIAPVPVMQWVGMTDGQMENLAKMNDNGASFTQIADYIETL